MRRALSEDVKYASSRIQQHLLQSCTHRACHRTCQRSLQPCSRSICRRNPCGCSGSGENGARCIAEGQARTCLRSRRCKRRSHRARRCRRKSLRSLAPSRCGRRLRGSCGQHVRKRGPRNPCRPPIPLPAVRHLCDICARARAPTPRHVTPRYVTRCRSGGRQRRAFRNPRLPRAHRRSPGPH